MALTLVATPGSANANSYETLSEANAFLATQLNTFAWDDAIEDAQIQALIMATRLMDTLIQWHGSPTTSTQALAWPMLGQEDAFGRTISSSIVPAIIKQAESLYALLLLQDPGDVVEREDIKELAVGEGSIRVVYRTSGPVSPLLSLPGQIRQMVSAYGTLSGTWTTSLRRV